LPRRRTRRSTKKEADKELEEVEKTETKKAISEEEIKDEKIEKILKELKINGRIVMRDNKKIVIVGSLADAFKLYRKGIYDVEVDETESLITRRK